MPKKSGKRNGAEVKKLTAKVETLRARVKKAEAATDKWKAKAQRLEADSAKQAKQVKKLQKAAVPVPDESWSVLRLRAAASEAGVVGYSRMTKAALLQALNKG